MQDFDSLADRLFQEQANAMRGPFALFGHSMGALLAHGLAQRQRAAGRPMPCALVASGSPAPSRRDPARFAHKDDDQALIADLRKQGGTPEEVFANGELMRMVIDVLRADYRTCESFRYAAEPPLAVPVHAFGGRQDDIDPSRVEAWSLEAAGLFTLDWFEGGHFFVREHEAAVLDVLTRHLAEAVGEGASRLCA
jgi:surfactin synthase thioesterase subunit